MGVYQKNGLWYYSFIVNFQEVRPEMPFKIKENAEIAESHHWQRIRAENENMKKISGTSYELKTDNKNSQNLFF